MNPDKLSPGDWFFGKVLHMGANWRTSLSGVGAVITGGLTFLAALPYELGNLSMIIRPEWKAKIIWVGLVATGALKFWNAICQKDKTVTGGIVQQTVGGAVADPGTQTLVDETVKASIRSGETVTPEQKQAVESPPKQI